MTQLINLLKRLTTHLKKNNPHYLENLQPGLTKSEIDAKLEDLNLNLPLEFYELYRWRNGTSYWDEDSFMFLPGFTFNSLEYAIDLYDDCWEEAKQVRFARPERMWNPEWFPIFSDGGGSLYSGVYLCLICNPLNRETSPLINVCHEAASVYLEYESLGHLFQTLVEGYESGACYLDEDCMLSWDDERYAQIYRQYNHPIEDDYYYEYYDD